MSFIAVAIGGATSIVGGILGSRAAGNAADTQSDSANYAADLTRQTEQEALQLQREALYNQRSDQLPWLQTGTGASYALGDLMGVGVPQSQQVMPTQQMPWDIANPASQTPSGPPYTARRTGQRGGVATPNGYTSNATYPQGLNGTVPPAGLPTSGANPNVAPYQAGGGDRFGVNPQSGDVRDTMVRPGDPFWTEPVGIDRIPLEGGAGTGPGTAPAGQQSYGTSGELALPMNEVMQDWQTEPGYEFRQQQGEDSVNRYLATTGMPFGGTAAKALMEYNQNLASNEYNNVYNRTASDRTDRYNRLAALAGMGQTSAQTVGNAGITGASNMGNIMMNSANMQGDYATQAANARASGMVGSANAWGGALSNIGQLPFQYMMFDNLFND